jgi:hypothetical protein
MAEEELRSLAAELHREHPHGIWEHESLRSVPGGYANSIRHEMYPIFALVGVLGLLILVAGCGNLGSLLLARGAARKREIAIRVAVGAGRGRLIRQLFTESLLLASLGSMAGLALGYLVLRGLLVWAEVPVWLDATPDRRVMVFAIATGFAAAILFGLTPAWQVARQRHRGTITRQFLIGAQVAAFSLWRACWSGRWITPCLAHQGFEYQQVISIDPHFHGSSPNDARVYLDVLESRLRALPGIEVVSRVSNPPLGNRWRVARLDRNGPDMVKVDQFGKHASQGGSLVRLQDIEKHLIVCDRRSPPTREERGYPAASGRITERGGLPAWSNL